MGIIKIKINSFIKFLVEDYAFLIIFEGFQPSFPSKLTVKVRLTKHGNVVIKCYDVLTV